MLGSVGSRREITSLCDQRRTFVTLCLSGFLLHYYFQQAKQLTACRGSKSGTVLRLQHVGSF